MDDVPVFRAAKKRKFARSRDSHNDEHVEVDTLPPGHPTEETGSYDEVNISNIIKLRKQSRPRGTGVQFSQQKHIDGINDEAGEDMALAIIDPAEERLKHISNRFIGSTGQVVDVDKHMVAYIDSELAKRQAIPIATARHQTRTESSPTASIDDETQPHQQPTRESHSTQSRPGPSQAQLAEFDLGPAVHETNLARTSAAIARAQSGLPPPPPDEPKPRRPRKPRLGRDGKPLRPRPRKRRDSADIARDAMVEQMLHEHKVDVFEGSAGEDDDNNDTDADADADERLAERFRQDFLDAMAERQQRSQNKAAAAAKAKATGAAVEPSGPKLGGGRSARAKMAQMQQQQRNAAQK